ncbi:oligopeptide/dipeptide ABC transporter ATP-binding protein [Angulomicrobium tetraedrale]|uniref:Oligopeptide/dipeptide ABC transporter ATP-binding protein n=1 Tax=Ancylobacter tetraedralis TaxID=217068 RepID=A0A839ZCT6_9HYPH|nr:ABC transporter ATP-binding protein [Ancylobacter tetraedralis]MBB3772601.1 oligopeptide/dipeptide ABC transporter ATP-binding protein [Ancylobacter tetraedralis]
MAAPLLDIKGLAVTIPTRAGERAAVSNVDFSVDRGEVVGLVGESGSGKSLSMLAVMGLLPRHFGVSGSIRFDGEEIAGAPERRLRALRGRRLAMVFQDPMTALNPVKTIGAQITEMIRLHNAGMSRAQVRQKALSLLEAVAIPAPERRFDQYPHEFSGGMRQRVVIAIAIANDPDLLIADEPTTALDVTIQAQIIEIFARLRAERGMAIVLITHDLGLVAGLADRMNVLYAGRIAERGPVGPLFAAPRHPYTASLLAAVPSIDDVSERLHAIPGTPPSLSERLPGCAFAPRCDFAVPLCRTSLPDLTRIGGSVVACHRANDPALATLLKEPA